MEKAATVSPQKERPILFSGPMVLSILTCARCGHVSVPFPCERCGSTEFRKTQTRRVMKQQPNCYAVDAGWPRCRIFNPSFDPDGSVHCANCGHGMRLTRKDASGIPCPYGKPGDRLWVRETWTSSYQDGCMGTAFRADMAFVQGKRSHPNGPHFHGKELGDHVRWRPSIFMPRWASRLTLEITEVRVQRLQEISEHDAQAEGSNCGCISCGEEPCAVDCFIHRPSYVDGFASIWHKINGADSWHANPWVWALTFERLPA